MEPPIGNDIMTMNDNIFFIIHFSQLKFLSEKMFHHPIEIKLQQSL